jgi:DNA-directed RNA polymerase specialized sigma24 family protein
VIERELYDLLKRCSGADEAAWEAFTEWVAVRARTVLRAFEKLRTMDREDIVAETLRNLLPAIRGGQIRGITNAEIDAYVCTSLRNQALNVLRGHARRRAAGESSIQLHGVEPQLEVVDDNSAPEQQAMLAELLARTEKLVMTWSPEDRYLFLAKLHGLTAQHIQESLRRPPFRMFVALATVDTRFHRLRERLLMELGGR